MSKSDFVNEFQKSIVEYIRYIIYEDWGYDNLEVNPEKMPTDDWSGLPDVWIGEKASSRHQRKPKIVCIEIEHKSGYGQALKNINHVIKWVKSTKRNRGALLHLIHSDSNLTENKLDIVLMHGIKARGKRFAYDFRIYDIKNLTKSKAEAKDKVASSDFRWALWQQLAFVKLVKH